MRRVIILLVIGTAAGGALALLSNGRRDPTTVASPAPTATPPSRTPGLTVVVETPVPPTPGPDGAIPATPQPGDPAASAPPARGAADVDCDDEQDRAFCSSTTESIVVSGGRLERRAALAHDTDYSQVPTTTVSSRVERKDRGEAAEGDDVDTLHITVTVDNRTPDATFVLPRREVIASLTRDGRPVALPESSGEPIALGPGAKLSATFSVPVDADGAWSWRGRTWFYRR